MLIDACITKKKVMKNIKLLTIGMLLITTSLFAQMGVITFECNNEIVTVQLSELWNNPNANIDLNGDGDINESDYIIYLSQQYDCEGEGEGEGEMTFDCNNEIITVQLSELWNNPNANIDWNGDGFVNESDFIIYLSQQYDCEGEGGEGEGEGENFYEEVFPGISLLNIDSLFPNMMDDELIFIIESSGVDISIISENGITFTPLELDGYLVFGPFDMEDILTFLVDGLEDYILIWGFFKPMTSEVLTHGAFSIYDDFLPTIFSVSYMNLDNIKSDLIVYNTSYLDLMGRAIAKPQDSGIFIKMENTNQGVLYDKIYIRK